jgi:DNA-binding MarR family transcriptional regulator
MVEQRISFLLNNLVREMNGQADALLRRKFELTYSQFVFLLIIGENDEVDVTRLALALGVTKGAVSKRLAWFIERGLVSTRQIQGDAKRVVISLSKKGSALAKLSSDFLEEEFLRAISKSPKFDQSILRTELQKMLQLLHAKRST